MSRISPRNAEWVAWLAMIMSFLFGCLTLLIACWNRSEATYFQGWHFLAGTFVWLVVLLHLRQHRLAEEEKIEEAKIKVSMWEDRERDPYSAQSRLEYFEKWGIPIASGLIGITLIAIGCMLFIRYIKAGEPAQIINAPITAAFLSGFAFFSLLLSKYALGMAQQPIWRLLKAGGSYLFVNAVSSFLCAVLIALTHIGWNVPEHYFAGIAPLLLAAIGLEFLLNLLLDVYRPRAVGQEVHPPYDSRLLDLCTGSKGFLRTIAQTLDYQFGFKISETWFYQFLEKAIFPLILFMALTIELLTSIVVIEAYEAGVVERFGKPRAALPPGFHLKLPWPLEKVYYFPVNRIQTLLLGFEEHEHAEHLLYTAPGHHEHHKESLFLIAHRREEEVLGRTVPVNLLAINVLINYRVRPECVLDYMQHSDPEVLLEGIGYRELTRFFAGLPMEAVLGSGRLTTYPTLRKVMQEKCDEMKLGVEIVFLGVCMAHPPTQTADAFEDVLRAEEEQQKSISEAKTYSQNVISEAEADVYAIESDANVYLAKQEEATRAEALAFDGYQKAYREGKEIYLARKYLKMLEERLPGKRLYVVCVPGEETTILNLEDSVGMGLTQLDLSEEKGSENND